MPDEIGRGRGRRGRGRGRGGRVAVGVVAVAVGVVAVAVVVAGGVAVRVVAMTVGSLFSGIGGLDLGLERAGMTVRWQSEIDPYASRVLAKHWPHVPNLGDVTEIMWENVERVDLICGGYPCQPFSHAGRRTGHDDPRHLWPWMLDAIRVLRPRYALMENVAGHLSLGFGRVVGDLAEIGYDTEWDCIPAAAVGAPHFRDRVFIVASDTDRDILRSEPFRIFRGIRPAVPVDDGTDRTLADAEGERSRPRPFQGEQSEVGRAQSECSGDGQWDAWAVEPDVGRVAHGVPARVDRLRALGNAVVPQVAELIGRAIMSGAETR